MHYFKYHKMTKEIWYLYIIRCGDNSFYTGIAKDVEKRFKKHRAGKAAKYTRARQPLELVLVKEIGSHSEALKEEFAIKQFFKIGKEEFIKLNNSFFEIWKSKSNYLDDCSHQSEQ